MLRGLHAAIILVAAAMLFFAVSGPGPVDASQYLGQVTWTWHKTMNETGSRINPKPSSSSYFCSVIHAMNWWEAVLTLRLAASHLAPGPRC